jgi:hypothetical protein
LVYFCTLFCIPLIFGIIFRVFALIILRDIQQLKIYNDFFCILALKILQTHKIVIIQSCYQIGALFFSSCNFFAERGKHKILK